jgi:hypothetical protein
MISLHRRRFAAVVVAFLGVLGVLASSASASPPKVSAAVGAAHAVGGSAAPTGVKRDLTVMTQNLYLGSSLAPALEATDADLRDGAVHELPGSRRGDRR